jgi:hypothetical protein
MPRIAVCGFFIECNRWSPVSTAGSFAEVFDMAGDALLEQMRMEKYPLIPAVFEALLKCSVTTSDIGRARKVWNEMAQQSLQDVRYTPSTDAFQTMLKVYSNAITMLGSSSTIKIFFILLVVFCCVVSVI